MPFQPRIIAFCMEIESSPHGYVRILRVRGLQRCYSSIFFLRRAPHPIIMEQNNSLEDNSSIDCEPVTSDTVDNISMIFKELHSVMDDNIVFYKQQNSTETTQRCVKLFSRVKDLARLLEPMLKSFSEFYHVFDFDVDTPGNGYRSLTKVVLSFVHHMVECVRRLSDQRFRKERKAMKMEVYCSALEQLSVMVSFAWRLLNANPKGQLFFKDDQALSVAFVDEYFHMKRACFYGRCLGFQFNPAIKTFLKAICIAFVSFEGNYEKHHHAISVAAGSLLSSGKYAMDPELCGEKFEEITKDINVQLLKGFWNITETEALAAIAKISSVPVHVNKEISFLPESFTLPLTSTTSQYLTVPVPLTYSGRAPIQMRLISHKLLEGQESQELNNLVKSSGTSAKAERKLKKDLAPKSKHLVVHFHGGGFVAHTSKSHEPYLKSWARDLGIPILSVDYSLSPETPFPRALEECFYAYCWALKNCSMLGWTGDYVCLAGDSAGGNLCLTVSLRAAACGIRIPDGIMAAYPATLLKATPLPSRLLATFDLLLPLSVLMKCLGAYTGLDPLNSNIIHPQLDNSLEEYYQSPLLAPDHVLKGLPPVHIVACSLDPLLDDSVMFAKRLRAIGQPVTLSIVEGLPHGFIGLAKFSKEVKDSAKICLDRMREVLHLQQPAQSETK
ncbi:hormone-sensitive lipase-like isoform X1 [Erpetoichthys calabaricus]|uniref:hormone-sensitive lipase-like isoform X1 n=2 Tax=Erpetoichthys calabaricus TaxID=27687 RepID=UPI002233E3DF|nr:hormone-sensitive lipase-like isoform X1 [Erpetoichthys calabaricus]